MNDNLLLRSQEVANYLLFDNHFQSMEKIKINNGRSNCPCTGWLEIFGDKWSLLIVRDIILFHKNHFKEFIDSFEGIATNILSDRLKKLVRFGIIEKSVDLNNKTSYTYSITPRGMDLIPIINEIIDWSVNHIDGVTLVKNGIQKPS